MASLTIDFFNIYIIQKIIPTVKIYFKIYDKIRLSTSICDIKSTIYNILIYYSFKLYQFIYIKNWSIYVKIGMIDHIDDKKGHQP